MPSAGFEFAIPATKRPQTCTLDRAATGIGSYCMAKSVILATCVLTSIDIFVHRLFDCVLYISYSCNLRQYLLLCMPIEVRTEP
jgi:hypothetical protein